VTAVVQTLNCTVGEIEELLAKGVPVEQIARDLQEPRQNVVAVWDRWRKNNGEADPTTAIAKPVVGVARLVPSTPTMTLPGHRVDPAAITVEALINAAARSASKRTQALGVRLADVAKAVRERLADERRAAEQAEATRREREAAAAEVERLEAQLRAARAKLSGRRAGGGSTPMQRDPEAKKPLSDARRAQLAELRKKQVGEWLCRAGCGRVSTTAAGRSSHERNCTGGAS
jgi:DNA-binding transcriptional MerR regulator